MFSRLLVSFTCKFHQIQYTASVLSTLDRVTNGELNRASRGANPVSSFGYSPNPHHIFCVGREGCDTGLSCIIHDITSEIPWTDPQFFTFDEPILTILSKKKRISLRHGKSSSFYPMHRLHKIMSQWRYLLKMVSFSLILLCIMLLLCKMS